MKKKIHRIPRRPSLLERIGLSADQRAQLAALFVTGAPVLAGIVDKRADVASVRAHTELAHAETARNLSALALFTHGPKEAPKCPICGAL